MTLSGEPSAVERNSQVFCEEYTAITEQYPDFIQLTDNVALQVLNSVGSADHPYSDSMMCVYDYTLETEQYKLFEQRLVEGDLSGEITRKSNPECFWWSMVLRSPHNFSTAIASLKWQTLYSAVAKLEYWQRNACSELNNLEKPIDEIVMKICDIRSSLMNGTDPKGKELYLLSVQLSDDRIIHFPSNTTLVKQIGLIAKKVLFKTLEDMDYPLPEMLNPVIDMDEGLAKGNLRLIHTFCTNDEAQIFSYPNGQLYTPWLSGHKYTAEETNALLLSIYHTLRKYYENPSMKTDNSIPSLVSIALRILNSPKVVHLTTRNGNDETETRSIKVELLAKHILQTMLPHDLENAIGFSTKRSAGILGFDRNEYW